MKKNTRLKRNQYYPFDDFSPPFVCYSEDPKLGDDISWRDLENGILKSRTQDSIALKHLVSTYRKRIKADGEDKALAEFWSLVGNLSIKEPSEKDRKIMLASIKNKGVRDWLSTAKPVKGLSFVTDEMRKVLYQAIAGNKKAAQVIVKAYPESIYLPFIAKTLAEVLVKHKYSKKKKRGEGDPDADTSKTDFNFEDNRALWQGFLPSRAGGSPPYTIDDMIRIVKKGRQQDDRPTVPGRKHLTSLYDDIASVMGMKTNTLKTKVKIKEGPGRPRK